MLCANPDVVVERGDKLVYCAGALADAYAELGGEVYYAGKPHRPLYDLALAETANARAARALGGDVALDRVLAIGDSVRTDLKGAQRSRRRLPVRHRRHSRRGARPAATIRTSRRSARCSPPRGRRRRR